MFADQSHYQVRCEWGLKGTEALAPVSDIIIVIDVLSFTTCVDVAVAGGAIVYPFRHKDKRAGEFARQVRGQLAGSRRDPAVRYSLSPRSLEGVPKGTRLVLPSPNGSTLSLYSGGKPTLAGCLRNCEAVAKHASRLGGTIAVIPAGERWKDDGSLRPSLEDWIGAGAVIHHLTGTKSPEAVLAQAAFESAREKLAEIIRDCASGVELASIGFEGDLAVATACRCSAAVPVLIEGAYRNAAA